MLKKIAKVVSVTVLPIVVFLITVVGTQMFFSNKMWAMIVGPCAIIGCCYGFVKLMERIWRNDAQLPKTD